MSTALRRRRTRPHPESEVLVTTTDSTRKPLVPFSTSRAESKPFRRSRSPTMATQTGMSATAVATESAASGPDYQVALDTLLEQAEAEKRPEPSDLSDAGDDSSQLTELDEEDDPADPEDDAVDDEDEDDEDDDRNEGESEEENDEVEMEEEEDDEDDGPDTEAETERLEISPEKLRRTAQTRNIADKLGRSGADLPSEVEEALVENDRDLDDSPSKRKSRSGADESDEESSLTDTEELPDALKSNNDKKRKRGDSSAVDMDTSSDLPAQKRSASTRRRMSLGDSLLKERSGLGSDDKDVAVASEDELAAEDDEEEDEDGEEEEEEEAIAVAQTEAVKEAVGKVMEEDVEASDHDLSDPPEDLERTAEAEGGDEEAVEEDAEEDDAAAKSEDEVLKKKAAKDALEPIEKLFAIFRDKLYDERLAALSAELDTLKGPNPTHPDYLSMMRTIDRRRDEKIRIEQVALGYKIKTLDVKTVAHRATLHGQFFQDVRAIREQAMEVMNAEFSKVQRERRQWNVKDPQYYYQFPSRRSEQIAQQTAYNKEVSLLSGMARYVGFPSAPDIDGAPAHDIESDMRQMRIRPQPSQFVAQVRNANRIDEDLAERQYLQKHAWANPGHPAHRQALLATPANQRRMNDIQHGLGGSGSTIDAGSNPPSGMAGASANREPASSPFDRLKQQFSSKTPSAAAKQAPQNGPPVEPNAQPQTQQTAHDHTNGPKGDTFNHALSGSKLPSYSNGPEIFGEQSGTRYALQGASNG